MYSSSRYRPNNPQFLILSIINIACFTLKHAIQVINFSIFPFFEPSEDENRLDDKLITELIAHYLHLIKIRKRRS